MPYVISLKKATDKKHKYTITFELGNGKTKTVRFGAAGYSDYTIHHDEARKQRYLQRHKKENWNDPFTAGSLSRWLLWHKTSLKEALKAYMQRFKLKYKRKTKTFDRA